MLIRPFQHTDDETEQVVALWEACGLTRPWNDPRKDIARKMTVQPELFLVGEQDSRVVATAMAGYDGHRGWVYYVAVDPRLQGGGHGARLMAEVERLLVELGCPKMIVQVRPTNERAVGFYERIGFEPNEALEFAKRLIPDD
ncbi:GNAT family acetyltransferase [Frondihabitans australicus]|uniref:Ribosomal protein S18 acetylase RimI-like enzyme n=1 Tax=Frondihabitans australicus TaxID=386892 RepID=A0A495IJS4_9MICO|nr:GNAT family acetyltransferase [Frondihabitans australicus]RKR76224.1 ribosomal protein S18 acetylase RimI-like enzyme [Frondihabitans australicus]